MSFLLLMMSLFAFDEVEKQSTYSSNEALFKDVAGRAAASVLEMTEIARSRADTSTVDSQRLVVVKTLPIPREVRGVAYTITLEDGVITVGDVNGRVSATATTLNFQFTPRVPPTPCGFSDVVCLVEGDLRADSGRILIKYEYDESPTGTSDTCRSVPYWNCITIS